MYISLTAAILIFGLVSCKRPEDDTSLKASAAETSESWESVRQQKQQAVDEHLAKFAEEARYFAEVPMSVKGMPYILFKSFPVVFPEIWPDGAFLDLGLPPNPRPGSGLPIGLGLTKDPQGRLEFRALRMVNKTCGTCHVGQVKVSPEKTLVIYGAPNAAYDENAFNLRMLRTVNDPTFTFTTFNKAFLHSAKRAKILDGYIGGKVAFAKDLAALEAVGTVKGLFSELKKGGNVGSLVFAAVEAKGKAFDKQDPLKPSLAQPHPGHVDSFGMGVARGLVVRDVQNSTNRAESILSPFPGMVDYHATFMQKRRGAANWDGSQNIPEVRPLITALSQVGDPALISYDVNLSALELTRSLPAPPYPFAVDAKAAARGGLLYEEHCASCHYPGASEIHPYPKSGTSSNRTRVISVAIRDEITVLYQKACDYIDERKALDKYKLFCHVAEERNENGSPTRLGRRMTDEELVRVPPTVANEENSASLRGYTADPLVGIWARAPYLHNGSVPTLFHLLVPSARPAVFVRGDLTYDQEKLGFSWEQGKAAGAAFDTRLEGMANSGHDEMGEYWHDRPEELADMLEYLKTL